MHSYITVTGYTNPVFVSTVPVYYICPDLLTLEQLGVADTWRGRFLRGFVRLLDRCWKV